MSLKILSLGSGLGLQDQGRAGWRRFGVPPGGALDRHAMRVANRLLGNRPDAPALEVRLQGASLEVIEDVWLALAGADTCSRLPAWTARRFQAGERIGFSQKAEGQFAYLVLPGGILAPRWFGSVSVDLRNGIGRALQAGDRLQAASGTPWFSTGGVARRLAIPEDRRTYPSGQKFGLLPGPQFEAFTPEAREQLVAAEWRVSTEMDRTGYRIAGPRLEVPDSIPSEPVLPGSLQVPGDGQPIITMADGPTVGGYPKIGVLRDEDRDRLAQCLPNRLIRFQWA